jgi:GAF domain-containing protein
MSEQNAAGGWMMPDDAALLRLEQIARVSTELSAAVSMAQVVSAAVDHAAEAIGASVSTLMLTEGDRLRLVAGHGLSAGAEQRWGVFPLAGDNPASEAARTGRAVVRASVADVERDYPILRDQMPAGRSLVCLPLENTAPAVGVIGLTSDAGWVPGPAEMTFLTAFAETCGQAVRRVRASEEAAQRAAELTYLAKVSLELASSLDYHRTLTNVANLTVPMLADWCAVDIATRGTPETVAVAHVDPDKVRWAWELQERYPQDWDAPTGAANVFRTGVSELYPDITDEMLVAGARDEEHLRLSRELDLRSALVVPIPGREQTLGTLTLIRTGGGAAYGPADVQLAEDVGRRAGLAIENAQLYGRTQDVALQLQRAVLPEAVDDIPHWEVAAHYAPGGRVGVGGDFYDAVPLPDGRLAFVIGDVMGHGVQAAAAMAHMRAAVRAYVSVDPDPCAVVSKLDLMFSRLHITRLVTLFYGVADRVSGQVAFANAGHYPGVLISAGQDPVALTAPIHLPLGAGGDQRETTSVAFGQSDVVLLFTDGLVERRGELIDEGLATLYRAAPGLQAKPLAPALDRLVEELVGGREHDDDVTALALRIAPVP